MTPQRQRAGWWCRGQTKAARSPLPAPALRAADTTKTTPAAAPSAPASAIHVPRLARSKLRKSTQPPWRALISFWLLRPAASSFITSGRIASGPAAGRFHATTGRHLITTFRTAQEEMLKKEHWHTGLGCRKKKNRVYPYGDL